MPHRDAIAPESSCGGSRPSDAGEFGIRAYRFDQARDVVAAGAAAFGALNPQYLKVTEQVGGRIEPSQGNVGVFPCALPSIDPIAAFLCLRIIGAVFKLESLVQRNVTGGAGGGRWYDAWTRSGSRWWFRRQSHDVTRRVAVFWRFGLVVRTSA